MFRGCDEMYLHQTIQVIEEEFVSTAIIRHVTHSGKSGPYQMFCFTCHVPCAYLIACSAISTWTVDSQRYATFQLTMRFAVI